MHTETEWWNSSQSVITTLQIGSVHLTETLWQKNKKTVNMIKDMFGRWMFDNVEYLGKKNKITLATYIHIRGYKTRQNYKKAITCTRRLD